MLECFIYNSNTSSVLGLEILGILCLTLHLHHDNSGLVTNLCLFHLAATFARSFQESLPRHVQHVAGRSLKTAMSGGWMSVAGGMGGLAQKYAGPRAGEVVDDGGWGDFQVLG